MQAGKGGLRARSGDPEGKDNLTSSCPFSLLDWDLIGESEDSRCEYPKVLRRPNGLARDPSLG